MTNIDDSLFFFPANNGTVGNGEWQNWDVTDGLMNVDGDSGAGEITLADYATANPGATLVNAPFDDDPRRRCDLADHRRRAGWRHDPQTRGEYFVDRVIVGEDNQDTLFDFGPNAETDGGTTASPSNPAHMQGWQHQAYDDVDYLNSNQEFVNGPGTRAGRRWQPEVRAEHG